MVAPLSLYVICLSAQGTAWWNEGSGQYLLATMKGGTEGDSDQDEASLVYCRVGVEERLFSLL